ncbi:hypothetical protein PPERSA_01719 [Pseudocohnilembus persalinus]|uniref:RRM domain-containing protein n=1 Tax=Pseudocohnilembus persalinus TaxID=266149 RepID=A0A0V0Q7S2_PSEPJ|nr:hypothetical protein PPERSA_01719 [Pseudocohnilembus persalinus]|eukprot:KRW98281.1 hypothetical protein PPERSA_01719 [Pseudocohnilembus persalinus]
MSQPKQTGYPSPNNYQSNSRSRSRSYDRQQKNHYNQNQNNFKKMIHIANLPTTVNEEQIQQEMKPYGKIEHLKLIKESPDGNPLQHSFYAFATLESQQDAQNIVQAFQNHQWNVNFKKSIQEREREKQKQKYNHYQQGSYEKPHNYNNGRNYQQQQGFRNQQPHHFKGNNPNYNNNNSNNSYNSNYNNRNYSNDKPYQRRQPYNNNNNHSSNYNQGPRGNYNNNNNRGGYNQNYQGSQRHRDHNAQGNFKSEQNEGQSGQQLQEENFANLLFLSSEELNKKLESSNNTNQIITEQILVRELFIGNISMEITEKQLLKTLEVYGKIEELELKSQNNVQYAFVKYYKIQDATKAFFNHQNIGLLLNQSLKIQFSDHQRRSNIVGDNEKEMKTEDLSNILYVNYHPNSHKVPTDDKIKQVCDEYGKVLRVNFNSFKNTPLKSFYLVEYERVEDVKKAYKSLSHKKYKLQDETCEIAILLKAENIIKGRDKSQFQPLKSHHLQNQNFNQNRPYNNAYNNPNQNQFNNKYNNDRNYNNNYYNKNQQGYISQQGNNNYNQQNQFNNNNFRNNNNYNQKNYGQNYPNNNQNFNSRFQDNINKMGGPRNYENNLQNVNNDINYIAQNANQQPIQNQYNNLQKVDLLSNQTVSDTKKTQNKDFIGAIDEIITEIDKDQNSNKKQQNQDQQQDDDNTKSKKQSDLLEDQDAIWSGFIAKADIQKVGVDLKTLSYIKEVQINDYHMQIIKQVPIEQAFKKQTILQALLIPSNGLYLDGFKILAKKLEDSQEAGYIQAENYNIYVIPRSKESDLICNLADDQSEMIAFVQEIKALNANKSLQQLLNLQGSATQKNEQSYKIQEDQEYRPDMDLNELEPFNQNKANQDKSEEKQMDQQAEKNTQSNQKQEEQQNQHDDLDIINDDELNTLLDTIDENL